MFNKQRHHETSGEPSITASLSARGAVTATPTTCSITISTSMSSRWRGKSTRSITKISRSVRDEIGPTGSRSDVKFCQIEKCSPSAHVTGLCYTSAIGPNTCRAVPPSRHGFISTRRPCPVPCWRLPRNRRRTYGASHCSWLVRKTAAGNDRLKGCDETRRAPRRFRGTWS